MVERHSRALRGLLDGRCAEPAPLAGLCRPCRSLGDFGHPSGAAQPGERSKARQAWTLATFKTHRAPAGRSYP